MRSMYLVVELIDLVTKHKSGELRCPATALILILVALLDCRFQFADFSFFFFFFSL